MLVLSLFIGSAFFVRNRVKYAKQLFNYGFTVQSILIILGSVLAAILVLFISFPFLRSLDLLDIS